MKIIAARKRVTGTLPLFEYRLLTPFDQIAADRQRAIPIRSSYGFPGGPFARTREVIAPMGFLRMEPGVARYEQGRAIEALAKRIDAVLLAALFPEMTASIVPVLLAVPSDPDDALVATEIDDIIGRFAQLEPRSDDLTGQDLGLSALPHARAA